MVSQYHKKREKQFEESESGNLFAEGGDAGRSRDDTRAIDLLWAAFRASPGIWAYRRCDCFNLYVGYLGQVASSNGRVKVEKQHIKNLNRVLNDKDETKLCQVLAASCLAGIYYLTGDQGRGAEFYRHVIAIADSVEEAELEKTIYFVHCGAVKVREVITQNRSAATATLDSTITHRRGDKGRGLRRPRVAAANELWRGRL